MKYTHILFDADNTLLNFNESADRALAQLFGDLNLEFNTENTTLFHRINQSWWDRIERGEVTFDQLVIGRMVDFLAAAGIDTDPSVPAENMVKYLSQHSILLDGALELIERLSPHCQLFIITNGIARVQRSRLGLSPITRYISHTFISDCIGYMKPSRNFFEYVFSTLSGVDPANMLVVGDSLSSDIQGGINAGLDTCWYNPNGKDPGALSPTYTVSRLSEVGDIILGS